MAAIKIKSNITTFIFENSEKLTLALNCLYSSRATRNLKSNLYLFNEKYYLTIISNENKSVFKISEFADNYSKSYLLISFLNEYAKNLIIENAISKYGKAFSKYF